MKINNLNNVFSLGLIQGSSFIIQLLAFPLILSKVGSERFSNLIIAETVAFFFLMMVNYSFEVTGIGKINNSKNLSKTFNIIFFSRLTIFTLLALIATFFWVLNPSEVSLLILIWLFFPLSNIFQNHYFFLATGSLSFYSKIILSSRVLALILIFIFLKYTNNIYIISIILNVTFLISGLSCLMLVISKYNLKINFPKPQEIKRYLIEGKEILFGNVGVYFFQDINILILSTTTIVDQGLGLVVYSLSEKLAKSLRALVRPFNQWKFKTGVKKINDFDKPNKESKNVLWDLSKNQTLGLSFIYIIILITIIIFDSTIQKKLDIPSSRLLLYFLVMGIAPILGILNFMFGTFGLNYLNRKLDLMKLRLYSGIFATSLTLLLVYFFKDFGAALSFLIAEIFLLYLTIKKFRNL